MTQLVELQAQMDGFQAAGIRVYAVSYDPQDALQHFSDRYGITYDLLSDEGSEVIRRYGILNTLIDPTDPRSKQFYGVPFPGTYVADESGIVTEKFFNRHYATRASAGTILDTALGQVLLHEESPQAQQDQPRIKVAAFLSDADLKLEVVETLNVRIDLAAGFHIYAEPLPEGFFPTTVKVKPTPGVRLGEPRYPPTEPMEFEALGVTLPVYEEVVDIAVPITGTSELWSSPEPPRSVKLDVVVGYQVCSDTVCYAPETATLSIDAPTAELIEPEA